jgi:hypothetical protein
MVAQRKLHSRRIHPLLRIGRAHRLAIVPISI